MADFEVLGRIVIDGSGSDQVRHINNELSSVQDSAGAAGGAFSRLGGIADFVFAQLITKAVEMAIGAIKNFVGSVLDAAIAHQRVMADFGNAIHNYATQTGSYAGDVRDAMLAQADALSKVTTFSKEQIIAGDALLLQFGKIGKDVLPQATKAVLDYAAKFGTDVPAAAELVGKALGDPVMGIGRLNTAFKLFEPEQMKAIKNMALYGHTSQAQMAILDALNLKIGGSAAAAADTFAGKMEILNNQFDEMKVSIGNAVLPALSGMLDAFTPIIEKALPGIVTFLTDNLVPALSAAGKAVADFIGWMGQENPIQAFGDALSETFSTGPLHDIGDFFYTLGGTVQNAFDGIKGALGGFGVWWDVFGPNIMQSVGKIFGGLQTVLRDVGSQIIPFFTKQLGLISTWFANNGQEISQFADLLANDFNNIIVPAIKAAWAFIGPILGGIVQVVLGIGKVIMDLALGKWPDAWKTIVDIGRGAAKAIFDAYDGLVRALEGAFGLDPAKINAELGQIRVIIVKVLKDAADAAGQLIGSIGLVIMGGLKTAADAAGQIIGGIGVAIMGGLKTASDDAQTIVTGIGAIFSHIGDAIVALPSTISTAIGNLGTIVSTGISNAIDGAKKTIEGFVDAGHQIIDGIIAGIKAEEGALLMQVAITAANALTSMKNALGIHSPSKLFMEVGFQIPAGLAEGIKQAAHLPSMALSSMTPGMMSAGASYASNHSIQNTANNVYNFGNQPYAPQGGGAADLLQQFRKS